MTGTAVVIDPRRDVDQYLEEAAELGLRIEHVILTHFHADFVAGHLEFRDRAGARIHLGAGSGGIRLPATEGRRRAGRPDLLASSGISADELAGLWFCAGIAGT